jgi:pilus assembly protein CpaF
VQSSIKSFCENFKNEQRENFKQQQSEWLAPAIVQETIEELASAKINQLDNVESDEKKRIWSELFGFGPLEKLIDDKEVTEILVNQFDQVLFEKNGHLQRTQDQFISAESYSEFVERLCQKCQTFLNREKPFVECQFAGLRITIIFQDLARGFPLLAIRKKRTNAWPLQQLQQSGWCSTEQLDYLVGMMNSKKNFLVVGGTGSGKTTVIQSLMNQLPEQERVVVIEDTQELSPPNVSSTSLLTHLNALDREQNVSMDDLLKRTLRLRPDRIAVGEIRGSEAKTLLMALSTGHDGSFGSMHARNAHEALLRLEMLVQMGAPEWSLHSIRRLIGITLQTIVVVERKSKQRVLEGLYEISSVENTGITIHQIL